MPEDLLTPVPEYKLYKVQTISIATFLGGPLAAGYMAAVNFKNLGEKKKATQSWILAIVITVVLFTCDIFIPAFEKIPNLIFPIIFSAITQVLVNKQQGAAIDQHIKNAGALYSGWHALLVALAAMVISVAFIMILLLIFYPEMLS